MRAEREQGITIDVAYRYFSTPRRTFILADCPGHVQYTRNTVTGATTADAVVVLVDARHGVVEQTPRHLAVAALLRVPHVIVAVNKIDLVGLRRADVSPRRPDVAAPRRELGMPDAHVHARSSALEGDNVVDRSAARPGTTAPALLELLETLPSLDELAAIASGGWRVRRRTAPLRAGPRSSRARRPRTAASCRTAPSPARAPKNRFAYRRAAMSTPTDRSPAMTR